MVGKSIALLKHGRPNGTKDNVPRKRKLKGHMNEVKTLEETSKNMIEMHDKSNVDTHTSPEEEHKTPEEA